MFRSLLRDTTNGGEWNVLNRNYKKLDGD